MTRQARVQRRKEGVRSTFGVLETFHFAQGVVYTTCALLLAYVVGRDDEPHHLYGWIFPTLDPVEKHLMTVTWMSVATIGLAYLLTAGHKETMYSATVQLGIVTGFAIYLLLATPCTFLGILMMASDTSSFFFKAWLIKKYPQAVPTKHRKLLLAIPRSRAHALHRRKETLVLLKGMYYFAMAVLAASYFAPLSGNYSRGLASAFFFSQFILAFHCFPSIRTGKVLTWQLFVFQEAFVALFLARNAMITSTFPDFLVVYYGVPAALYPVIEAVAKLRDSFNG